MDNDKTEDTPYEYHELWLEIHLKPESQAKLAIQYKCTTHYQRCSDPLHEVPDSLGMGDKL